MHDLLSSPKSTGGRLGAVRREPGGTSVTPCRARRTAFGVAWSAAWLLIVLALVGVPRLAAQDAPSADVPPVVVRLLPILQGEVSGKTQVETLVIDQDVRQLVFYVDGEEAARRKRLPWNAEVTFAQPPKEQTLKVVALGSGDRVLAEDSLTVNRHEPVFEVHITAIEGDAATDQMVVVGEVTLPRQGELEAVQVLLNDAPVATVGETRFAVPLPIASPSGEDFVQVVATLRDGRQRQDTELLKTPKFGEELNINLVQLQVLVTQRNGAPVADLKRDDFEVHQDGAVQTLQQLQVAADVALVLGLALDSSGSMTPLWASAQQAAYDFLGQTLGPRDRAFVVEFNTELRLRQALTGDRQALFDSLAEIVPDGGTALYDAVLFSLMQFTDEPGRRALVVLTDGYDANSSANPKRAVEIGRRLGVPVYVIAMPAAGRGGSRGPGVQELKLLTEPTGGRLLRLGPGGGLERAFRQINLELRHQYVLTYYADRLPGEGRQGVKVTIPGRKDLEVRAVIPLDQVQRAEKP